MRYEEYDVRSITPRSRSMYVTKKSRSAGTHAGPPAAVAIPPSTRMNTTRNENPRSAPIRGPRGPKVRSHSRCHSGAFALSSSPTLRIDSSNRAPASFTAAWTCVPVGGIGRAIAAPQLLQNLAVAAFATPHRMQYATVFLHRTMSDWPRGILHLPWHRAPADLRHTPMPSSTYLYMSRSVRGPWNETHISMSK